jgi:tRNA pseudouridine38-40 synthase
VFNVALCIEYLGTNYHGWQKQPNVNSIQAELERALSKIAQEEIKIICAGRTDAGVHAYNQYASFSTNSSRSILAWSSGVNAFLPDDIRVKWAKILTDENFNARHSALSRSYRYIILNSISKSAIYNKHTTWVGYVLDEKLMHDSAQVLLGTHDFTSFRGPDCQSLSPVRTVLEINIQRSNEWIYIDITANAFLHNMVRNIVGSLIEIGRLKRDKQWLVDTLLACDRTRAAATATAPACGLYLNNVVYDLFELIS